MRSGRVSMITGPFAVLIVIGNAPSSTGAAGVVVVGEGAVVVVTSAGAVAETRGVGSVSVVADDVAHAAARTAIAAAVLRTLRGMVLLSLEEPSGSGDTPPPKAEPHTGRKASWLIPRRGFTVAGQRRILTGLRFTHGAGRTSRMHEASSRRGRLSSVLLLRPHRPASDRRRRILKTLRSALSTC